MKAKNILSLIIVAIICSPFIIGFFIVADTIAVYLAKVAVPIIESSGVPLSYWEFLLGLIFSISSYYVFKDMWACWKWLKRVMINLKIID